MSTGLDPLTEIWFDRYIRRGMCSLCGQYGILDTRLTAVTPTGFRCGAVHFCICPNGQAMRNTGKSADEWQAWQWERANELLPGEEAQIRFSEKKEKY